MRMQHLTLVLIAGLAISISAVVLGQLPTNPTPQLSPATTQPLPRPGTAEPEANESVTPKLGPPTSEFGTGQQPQNAPRLGPLQLAQPVETVTTPPLRHPPLGTFSTSPSQQQSFPAAEPEMAQSIPELLEFSRDRAATIFTAARSYEGVIGSVLGDQKVVTLKINRTSYAMIRISDIEAVSVKPSRGSH
jgi:hypothetical protein